MPKGQSRRYMMKSLMGTVGFIIGLLALALSGCSGYVEKRWAMERGEKAFHEPSPLPSLKGESFMFSHKSKSSLPPLPLYQRRPIFIGMNKNQLAQAWGKPLRRDIAGQEKYQNERWLYRIRGKTKVVYLEGGVVHSWQTVGW